MAEILPMQAEAAATAEPALGPGAAAVAGDPADPIYVYAIVDGGALVLPPGGIDPERPVTTLAAGGVQAVISAVRYELFNEDAVRFGLEDRAWLAMHVLAHQRVLDVLVASTLPVVPMRFCTIYPDAQALRASLERHGAAFAAELDRLRGKQEWGLKQVVDIQALQAAIAQGHPTLATVAMDGEIERVRKQLAGMSTGAAFLLKKRLTNLIAERAQSIAFAVADETLRVLGETALDAAISDLPKDRPEVCLNAAFWVETARYDEFIAQLEQLAADFAAVGVRYELSGPWPPHHFLRLALDRADETDEASE